MYHLIRGDLSLLLQNIFCKLWERYFILFWNLNLFLFLKIYQNIQKTHSNFRFFFSLQSFLVIEGAQSSFRSQAQGQVVTNEPQQEQRGKYTDCIERVTPTKRMRWWAEGSRGLRTHQDSAHRNASQGEGSKQQRVKLQILKNGICFLLMVTTKTWPVAKSFSVQHFYHILLHTEEEDSSKYSLQAECISQAPFSHRQ